MRRAQAVGQQWVKGQMEQQARYRLARPAARPPPLLLLVAAPPRPRRHRLRLHHQELTFDLFLFKEINTLIPYCTIDSSDLGLGDIGQQ